MQIPANGFKKAIKAGETQLGLWLSSANPYTAEIAATCGYDWLLIDGEHGPNDVPTILSQLQAIAPYPSHAIVRPVNKDPALIKQVLDIGAQTLLIPMVDTAEEAQALVSAMRYAPRGTRGVGASVARAARWGRIDNYVQVVEQELCLLVQVETVAALQHLDAITAVEGVDGVFIGPADLSASMDHIGDAGHPAVRGAIEDAIGRIRAQGKAAGILVTDPDAARHYLACGANFVGIAVDTMLLSKAMADALAELTGAASPAMPRGSY
ncbi:HpcH/HpaI aldolase/citrate lyase family protein [Thiohalocapsa marina]|uniref:HpcH/HpaI aldolase/citrate lyase family protein n=1 Tax=Thiohalocapsa marina TaxID=424902 RepID=A0A5M8FHD3_9GAMM|nr:HpcH/HpaI aldolase/citrate lyase family protein [Thiohalocapsa marina]KAA6183176.1 HpcH/HpaI aldolase/citrate lyase family protein [Thiohalocapsa marina]